MSNSTVIHEQASHP